MSDLKYWLGFNLVKGIGPAKLQALLDYFGALGRAWHATELQLEKLGFDKRAIRNLLAARRDLDLDRCMAQTEKAGVTLLTWASPEYPTYLREVPNAPTGSSTAPELNAWAARDSAIEVQGDRFSILPDTDHDGFCGAMWEKSD